MPSKIESLITAYNEIKYKHLVYSREPSEIDYYNRKLRELDRAIKAEQREIVDREGYKRCF